MRGVRPKGIRVNLNDLSTDELIDLYARIPDALKERGVIRTKNFLGDPGEYVAIQHYNSTPGLPNLQAAPAGTQNVDAISRNGERYSIKATRSNGTGVFYGLGDPESKETDKQKFEYVIIVQFFDNFRVRRLLELTWDQGVQTMAQPDEGVESGSVQEDGLRRTDPGRQRNGRTIGRRQRGGPHASAVTLGGETGGGFRIGGCLEVGRVLKAGRESGARRG